MEKVRIILEKADCENCGTKEPPQGTELFKDIRAKCGFEQQRVEEEQVLKEAFQKGISLLYRKYRGNNRWEYYFLGAK